MILKEGVNVRGMNTAATLWCTAAIGTLTGAGFALHAIVGVVAILAALRAIRPLARWAGRRQERQISGETYYQIRVICDFKRKE